MVENIQPRKTRLYPAPYGSAVVLFSTRIAAGSLTATQPVDLSYEYVKTFSMRGNQHGSWFLQYNWGYGSSNWLTTNQGTFPASTGSATPISFTEAAQLARILIKPTATGSFSVYFGGLLGQRLV